MEDKRDAIPRSHHHVEEKCNVVWKRKPSHHVGERYDVVWRGDLLLIFICPYVTGFAPPDLEERAIIWRTEPPSSGGQSLIWGREVTDPLMRGAESRGHVDP